jgi:orotidine-5'-phosphate decarboxylase
MNAADRLIVALDSDAADMGAVFLRLYRETSIRFFKVGPQLLLQHSGMVFIENMIREGHSNGSAVDLFLDLKVYDTRDTVARVVRHAFDLGARFVTVHATPSVMEAAMRAKPTGERHKVLAVSQLSDQERPTRDVFSKGLDTCDGIICPPYAVNVFKQSSIGKIFVCPGIRRRSVIGYVGPDDDHVYTATPAGALSAGADYLVVGRPIWRAPDPVAVARAILAEMGSVS